MLQSTPYRLADEEDAEDDLILRRLGFDAFGVEQPRPGSRGGTRSAGLARTTRRRRLLLVMTGAAGIAALVLIAVFSVKAAAGGHGGHGGAAWTCPDGAAPGGVQPRLGSTTFFVIGDWGRKGNANQRKVAAMMSQVARCMPPAFIISTGDNFYESGLRSANDVQMQQSFTGVYSQPELQVPWWAVLGNHDYNDGIDPADSKTECAARTLGACPKDCCYSSVWQFTGRLNDARWHCQNGTYAVPFAPGPPGAAPLLDIVLLDTNPFIGRYADTFWYSNAGGIWQQDAAASKAALQRRLAASSARWKLVVGHHPIASYGEHCHYSMGGDCKAMRWLQRELKSAGVAAYLCGHDHDQQLITQLSDPNNDDSAPLWPVYAVSGAGSNTRKDEASQTREKDGYSLRFMSDDQGFLAVQANSSHLALYFYAAGHARPVHTAVLAARAAAPLPRPATGRRRWR